MNSISKSVLLLCIAVVLYTAFIFYPRWEQTRTEATIGWDVSGYYMYLPAFFIYKDAKKMNFRDSIIQKYNPTPDFHQAYHHQNSGNYVFKYSSGQAVAMMPWFFIAHIQASISKQYPADGFSFPYQFWIGFGLLLWALLGLFYLRKILLLYFDEWSTAISIFLVIIGSNLLNYVAVDQAMTHSTLFTIYVLIIWNTIKFYQSITIQRMVILGLLCGWAALIRPTDLIAVLIPLFWGLSTLEEVKLRLKLILQNWQKVILFSVCAGLVGFIQLIYWQWATGEWIVYSYQDQGFSWFHPHIKNYTFSYKSGWLRYSPIMILSFVGIIPFIFQKKNLIPVLLLMGLSFYLVTVWDLWDYGGTGGRAMVQYYPFFIFPMAALVTAARSRLFYTVLLGIFCFLGVYANIWWVYHAHTGKVQVLHLTKAYYWKKVGKWSSTEADTKLLDNNYSYEGKLMNPLVIYKNNFDQDTSNNKVLVNGNSKIHVQKDLQFTEVYNVKNPGISQNRMRVSAFFTCGEKEWTDWKQTQFIVRFYNGNVEIQTNLIKVHRFLDNGQEREIYLDAKCPPGWTHISVFFWNAESDKTLWIDDLKVVLFDE